MPSEELLGLLSLTPKLVLLLLIEQQLPKLEVLSTLSKELARRMGRTGDAGGERIVLEILRMYW
jgi:hypothetical protein